MIDRVRNALRNDETEIITLSDDETLFSVGGAAAQPDVVLLDCGSLPDFSRRMRRVRRRWATSPVLVLGARDEAECARLLNEGADDACVAGSPIVEARLHAIARRAHAVNAERRRSVGDVVLDPERRRVWCAGEEVELSPREYDVLTCLMHYAPRVVGRRTMAEFVWGRMKPQSNAVEVYVGYLRRKLASSREVAIATVRRGGYLLGRS